MLTIAELSTSRLGSRIDRAVEAAQHHGSSVDIDDDTDVLTELHGVSGRERPTRLQDHGAEEVLDDLLQRERQHEAREPEEAEQRPHPDPERVERIAETREEDQVADDAGGDDRAEPGARPSGHDRTCRTVGGDRHRERTEQDRPGLQPIGARQAVVDEVLEAEPRSRL